MIIVGNGKIEIKSDRQILKEAREKAWKAQEELGNETLVAENVEVDMETLRIAQNFGHTHKRLEAALEVIDAVIKALYPKDREKLEAYIKGE